MADSTFTLKSLTGTFFPPWPIKKKKYYKTSKDPCIAKYI